MKRRQEDPRVDAAVRRARRPGAPHPAGGPGPALLRGVRRGLPRLRRTAAAHDPTPTPTGRTAQPESGHPVSGFGRSGASGREGTAPARTAVPPPRLGRMTAHHVFVLTGPNLGRLGSREPEVYGSDDARRHRHRRHPRGRRARPRPSTVRQTNDEGELIGWLHEAVDAGADVVLNPAAFTHYSYALRDACAMVTGGGRSSSRCTCPTPPPARSSGTPRSWPGSRPAPIAGFGLAVLPARPPRPGV